MTRCSLTIRLAIVTALVAALAPAPAPAAWPHPSTANMGVATTTSAEHVLATCADGSGGVIIAWYTDWGSGFASITGQRYDAAGHALWGPGAQLSGGTYNEDACALVPDGAGGVTAITVSYYYQHYMTATHVTAAGIADRTTDVCYFGSARRSYPVAVAGSGGSILVAWQDWRNGVNPDVYAQCLNAAGTAIWDINGVRISTSVDADTDLAMVPDGYGGAIVVWRDQTPASSGDIYGQRIHNGGYYWGTGGLPLAAATGDQAKPVLIADSSHGAILAWQDARGANLDIYAQRFGVSGAAVWAAPVVLCSATGDQSNPQIVTDNLGGAIVAWQDARGADLDIYAQRVNAAGAPIFTANGLGVVVTSGVQQNPVLAPDGVGGAVVAWSDLRAGAADIYALRMTSSGGNMWTNAGVVVSSAAYDQTLPVIVNAGGANSTIVWNDTRAAQIYGYEDVYAQRVDEWGMLGAEPVITSVRDVPNDQGGKVKVSWTASPLDIDPAFRSIDTYLVFRSVPTRAAAKAGAVVTRDPGDAMRPGVLYATGSGDKTYYWEYLASQTAYRLPTYSYLAAATGDSLAGSNPRTAFLVEARTGTTRWWPSEPDSGYSVDNLPPSAPAFLVSNHAAGATRVRWTPNAETDLATYRLYRGTGAGFVPGPASLVAALPDTGYVDSGAPPYSWYKLTAVDAHGNESPVATLSPQQISGVPGDGVPMATALIGAAPNPFNPSTLITYSLGRPETVRLTIYDASGRLVRTLASGAETAGPHQVRWDGTADDGARMASAVYFCRLEAGAFSDTRRLTLVK